MLKSRTLMALAVTGALGWSTAQALEVELVCDQDPLENSAASCVMIAPSSPIESAGAQSESLSEPMFVSHYDRSWMIVQSL